MHSIDCVLAGSEVTKWLQVRPFILIPLLAGVGLAMIVLAGVCLKSRLTRRKRVGLTLKLSVLLFAIFSGVFLMALAALVLAGQVGLRSWL